MGTMIEMQARIEELELEKEELSRILNSLPAPPGTTLYERLQRLQHHWYLIARDNFIEETAALRAEVKKLRAYKAECEKAEPDGKIIKWINANTAICAGEGFNFADTGSLVYLSTIPSDRVVDSGIDGDLWSDKNSEDSILSSIDHDVFVDAIINLYEDIRCLKEDLVVKPRITEQDAREIALSAFLTTGFVNGRDYLDAWFNREGHALLNKLNADKGCQK